MAATRILVVEDENIVAKDIQNRLEALGYEVVGIGTTGPEAVRQVTEHNPHLVLMDIMLKGDLDGIQTAEQIQAICQVPVVYLTAYADQVTLDRAKITEPYGYILKPFEERELHITIEMALYKHRMELNLRESRQWLATTLTSIADAVIATDITGKILFINPVAELLTGWKEKDALYQNIAKVFIIRDEKSRAALGNTISDLLRRAAPESAEGLLLAARDGKEISIDNRAAPIRDDQGRLTGVVLTFHDITQRKAAEERIRRMNQDLLTANEELQTLDKLKNNLLSNVSHELRTPLVAVRGYTEMIAGGYSGPVSDTQKHQLQISLRSIDRLVLLIDSLLDFSKLELGEEHLHLEKIDLLDIAGESISLVMPKAQAREITITREVPDRPLYVYADRNKIFQVFINLLENAVKFNHPQGSVAVGITPTADDMVRVTVADTGIGIDEDKLEKIFERFYQVDSSSTRKFSGMGIGLSLCRDIIKFHQGDIFASSRAGKGTTLTFLLPRYGKPAKKDSAARPVPVTKQEAVKVMIFDNDQDSIRYLETMLTSEAYRPFLVTSRDEALDTLEHERIDVMLLGISGKRSGGWTLCRQITTHPRGQGLPILIMAPRGIATKAQAKKAGARDMISKPVRKTTLVRKLGQVVTR